MCTIHSCQCNPIDVAWMFVRATECARQLVLVDNVLKSRWEFFLLARHIQANQFHKSYHINWPTIVNFVSISSFRQIIFAYSIPDRTIYHPWPYLSIAWNEWIKWIEMLMEIKMIRVLNIIKIIKKFFCCYWKRKRHD